MVTGQQQDKKGTRADVVVENIRKRWYEVTVLPVRTTVPGPNPFIIGPANRGNWAKRQLKGLPVGLGASIAFSADGQSPLAIGMHVIDLVLIGTTGSPIPGNLIDTALQLLQEVQPLFGFGAAVGAHLAQLDVCEAFLDLRELPDLAANEPSLREALRILGVSDNQLVTLKNVDKAIKLFSIIAKELETLTAPQFDHVSLIAR